MNERNNMQAKLGRTDRRCVPVVERARSFLRLVCDAPGATKTDIIARELAGGDPNYNEANISAMHPMKRLGRPEEIANGIAFLLSDEASFITGHILNIDGGFQAK